jgi:hypothetical protein
LAIRKKFPKGVSGAGIRHLFQAEIDAVGQEDGEISNTVAARNAGPEIGEGLREADPVVGLEREIGDA